MKTLNFKIKASEKSSFIRKFKKFSKKAEKIGCESPTVEFSEEYIEPSWLTGAAFVDKKTGISCIDATVNYEIPVIEGWKVIGNRKRINDDIFTNVITDDDCTVFHKSSKINCEHCGTKHYRTKSILLKNEISNTIIEVGSSCTKDFLGHFPNNIDIIFDAEENFSEFGNFTSNDATHFSLIDILTLSAHYTNQYGYSNKSADFPTAERVYMVYDKTEKPRWWTAPVITENDTEIANNTLEYFKSLEPENHYSNSYMTNCIKISENEYVANQLFGYAVSMICAYLKHTEYKKENKPESNYQGEINERLKNIPVIVKMLRYKETQWGITTIITFEDNAGNVYISFYKGTKYNLNGGEKCYLTGTIKKHNEFKGVKQTIINRIILMERS